MKDTAAIDRAALSELIRVIFISISMFTSDYLKIKRASRNLGLALSPRNILFES
ncbi:hypothetical protein V6D52_08240 [Idiomarina loihiensis]|uniref:hypothetical protein n=1 Tax=Idiomarina loihiensis TaxID=135577 RepID=UPI003158EBA1